MAGIFDNINSLAKKGGSIANNVKTVVSDVAGVAGTVNRAKQTALGFLDNPVGALSANLQFDSIDQLQGALGLPTPNTADNRVRLRAMQPDQVYGPNDPSNILQLMYQTNGLLFPYTPTIDWTQSVDYATTSLTHTNQDYKIYKSTPSTQFRLTGDFTISNYREGQYMLAVIHFLRTVSKMYFGKQNKTPGMPPPVLLFSGYGDFMFNDLPVILTDHSYSLSKDANYIDIATAGGTATLPSVLTISMSLVVQNTPKRLREEFNLDSFRTGKLMKNKGWI